MRAPRRRTAPRSPGAGGGKPAAKEHAQADLQAVGGQGRAFVVAQACPGAVQMAVDASAEQADRAAVLGFIVADDRCPAQVQKVADETGGVQRWLSAVLDPTSANADGSHAGLPVSDAFLQEAIGQLKVDFRAEVLQIKPAGDLGPPKLQPTRVRVGREPSTQDVPDHGGPAGLGAHPTTASRPRRSPGLWPGRAIPPGRRARPVIAPPAPISGKAPERSHRDSNQRGPKKDRPRNCTSTRRRHRAFTGTQDLNTSQRGIMLTPSSPGGRVHSQPSAIQDRTFRGCPIQLMVSSAWCADLRLAE